MQYHNILFKNEDQAAAKANGQSEVKKGTSIAEIQQRQLKPMLIEPFQGFTPAA